MAQSKKYDAVICIGAILKGDTSHNAYIANEVVKGISQINLSMDFPVIFGVITPDTLGAGHRKSRDKTWKQRLAGSLNSDRNGKLVQSSCKIK